MKSIVSYLSKPNHEARDASGRFEGTFRWGWLASLWATLHPSREMHLVPVALPARPAAVSQATIVVPAENLERPSTTDIRRAPARRPRRRPAVQRAA
jgi:hypothetical protein